MLTNPLVLGCQGTERMMQSALFLNLLTIAADSPAQLRRPDVYRVVSAACDMACASAFCDWLAALRPDLQAEITECLQELSATT